jgi:hypothetical protein
MTQPVDVFYIEVSRIFIYFEISFSLGLLVRDKVWSIEVHFDNKFLGVEKGILG